MTDPVVARLTFTSVVGHEPTPPELARVMARRLAHLPDAVASPEGYRVLPGVTPTLEEALALGSGAVSP